MDSFTKYNGLNWQQWRGVLSLHCCSTFPRSAEGKPLHPIPATSDTIYKASHFYLSNYFFNNSLAIFNIDDDGGGCVLCARATQARRVLSLCCVYVFFVCVCARDAFYAMLSLLLCFQCEECRLCILAFD